MNVLYVRAFGGSDSTDIASINLLIARGDTVTQIADNAAVPTLTDYDIIILGSSAATASLGTNYRDVAKPLLSMRSIHWTTNLELTTATTSAGSSTTFNVTAAGAAHAIGVAAGVVEGSNTLNTSNLAYDRATNTGIAAAATQLAWQFATSNITWFVYESGATMCNSIVAAARRVAMGMRNAASGNALAQACFLESVDWAANVTVPDTPPTADFTVDVDEKTVTVTSAAVAGTNPITSTLYDWGDGSVDDAGPTHTYASGNSYTITQTVSDGTLSDTEATVITTVTDYNYTVVPNSGTSASVIASRPDV